MEVAVDFILQAVTERSEYIADSPFPLLPPAERFVARDRMNTIHISLGES